MQLKPIGSQDPCRWIYQSRGSLGKNINATPRNPCFFSLQTGCLSNRFPPVSSNIWLYIRQLQVIKRTARNLCQVLESWDTESSLPVFEHKLKYPKNMDLIWKKMGWDMSFIKTFIQKTTIQRQKSSALWLDFSDFPPVNYGKLWTIVDAMKTQGSFHYQTPTNVHKRRIKRKHINM